MTLFISSSTISSGEKRLARPHSQETAAAIVINLTAMAFIFIYFFYSTAVTRIKVNSRRCQPPGVESQQETADSAGLSKQRQAATETQTDFFFPPVCLSLSCLNRLFFLFPKRCQ